MEINEDIELDIENKYIKNNRNTIFTIEEAIEILNNFRTIKLEEGIEIFFIHREQLNDTQLAIETLINEYEKTKKRNRRIKF